MAKISPLVSILVPVYAVERYIERCAVSLMEQTYGNVEYVFVDDGGKDRSIEILREVVGRYPERVGSVKIVSHERNRGIAAARNTAVKTATGDFIMFVDSDDWVDSTIVEKCVERQAKTGADITICDYQIEMPNGKVAYEDWPDAKDNLDLCLGQLQTRQRWGLWAQLTRRSLYTDNNILMREGCNMGEDFHTSPRLAYFAVGGIAYVHERLYHYNKCNAGSYTQGFDEAKCRQVDGSYEVLEEFFADKGKEFVDAIRASLLNTYIGYVRRISIIGGHDELYERYRERIKQLAPPYRRQLSTYKRLTILLVDHRRLLSAVCKLVQGNHS